MQTRSQTRAQTNVGNTTITLIDTLSSIQTRSRTSNQCAESPTNNITYTNSFTDRIKRRIHDCNNNYGHNTRNRGLPTHNSGYNTRSRTAINNLLIK